MRKTPVEEALKMIREGIKQIEKGLEDLLKPNIVIIPNLEHRRIEEIEDYYYVYIPISEEERSIFKIQQPNPAWRIKIYKE